MKKISTALFLLLFLVTTYQATVKTSIIDGDWSNPATWNPSGIPFAEDTVIINSHVFADINVDVGINWLIINANDSLTGDSIFGLHGNLKVDGIVNLRVFVVGDGVTTINNGLIKGEIYATGNITYDNMGVIESDSLNTSETPFDNNGLIDNNMLTTSGDFNNNNNILVAGNFIQSGTFVNTTGSFINAIQQLIVSGNFTNQIGGVMLTANLTTSNMLINDGDITCDNWTNGGGTATGTTGKFCVAQCFINNASITGTVDVCDATPVFLCDFNLGTIAGTVTFCTVSPCATTVGLAENQSDDDFVSVYPNPSSGIFNIDVKNNTFSVQVMDVAGKVVLKKNNAHVIDLTHQNEGIYFLTIISGEKVVNQKVLVSR